MCKSKVSQVLEWTLLKMSECFVVQSYCAPSAYLTGRRLFQLKWPTSSSMLSGWLGATTPPPSSVTSSWSQRRSRKSVSLTRDLLRLSGTIRGKPHGSREHFYLLVFEETDTPLLCPICGFSTCEFLDRVWAPVLVKVSLFRYFQSVSSEWYMTILGHPLPFYWQEFSLFICY